MNKVLILIAAIALSGCATTREISPQVVQQNVSLVITKCPTLKQYTKEELKVAAQETIGLPSNSQVAKLLSDYSKLRDACRAVARKAAVNK